MEKRWDIDEGTASGALPKTILSPGDGAGMVLVPAGEFTMGIDEKELCQRFFRDDWENPVAS